MTGFPKSTEEMPDLMAPSRITDLHVSMFDPDTGKAQFRWTAVGGDMDRGKGALH